MDVLRVRLVLEEKILAAFDRRNEGVHRQQKARVRGEVDVALFLADEQVEARPPVHGVA